MAGLVLGVVTLSQWAPYDDYALIQTDGWLLVASSMIIGTLPPLIFEKMAESLVADISLVIFASAVPVIATVITSHLLGTVELLDVILYSSVQRALGQSVALFVFTFVGFAAGIIIGSRTRRG